MKKLILISCFLVVALVAKAQTNCATLPCPSILNRPVIENFNSCGAGVAFYEFKLAPGSSTLCSGESLTFTLFNSAGIPIVSGPSGFVNLQQLCTGNYTICVELNSPFRDCPPSCMTFWFVNRGEGCCPDE